MVGTLDIKIERTKASRISQVNWAEIEFGKVYSDHMYMTEYEEGEWRNLRIVPYENLSLPPASTVFHYAQSIFEGLKAYKNDEGEVLVFRPQANAERMVRSAHRMCIPAMPEEAFMQSMTELLKVDRDWVPSAPGTSLYIRPVTFATDPYIGIRPSDHYVFMIFTAPVGAYYSHPVKVKVEQHFTRAAAGGVGAAKTAGNYAASLFPAVRAQRLGYHQLIWTDAKEHEYIEESGTMNVMFVINDTLVTPPTGDTILAGITRDSVITIAKEMGLKVEERRISVSELVDALKSGDCQEAFGVGTAATIAHISLIGFDGVDYELPPAEEREISNELLKTLDGIKTGKIEDKYGWVYKI